MLAAILETLAQAWRYGLAHQVEFLDAAGEHLALAGFALLAAAAASLPLGLWTARSRRAAQAILNTASSLRVVPSLAVLFLVVPYLGLNNVSAGLALALLAVPPILLNSDAAFRSLDPAVLDAARAVGMTGRQRLLWVELPLALPVILAGARTAAVEVIASATLAAFVGSGGLGIYITRGFALYDYAILMVGAVPVALLSLAAELLLGAAQRAAGRRAAQEAVPVPA